MSSDIAATLQCILYFCGALICRIILSGSRPIVLILRESRFKPLHFILKARHALFGNPPGSPGNSDIYQETGIDIRIPNSIDGATNRPFVMVSRTATPVSGQSLIRFPVDQGADRLKMEQHVPAISQNASIGPCSRTRRHAKQPPARSSAITATHANESQRSANYSRLRPQE
ncbi:hypothetical protein BaRGS_00022851 [Batillaria attramentaria]|uniref:Uncharacterized protein n=1 Tax=Batillaria attramentaria TaxID=370345 RepID=A0ABD0KFR6_9CAEN